MRRALISLGSIAVTAFVATVASCALGGFNRVEGTSAPTDAGSDGDTDAGDGDAPLPGCDYVKYPSPPQTPDGPSVEPFVVAVRQIEISPSTGLDLDGLNSCHGDGPNCKEVKEHCDDADGRDNEAAELFGVLSLGLPGFTTENLSKKAGTGVWSLLLRISEYDGLDDDPSVRLEWFVTAGYDAPPPATPAWNGADPWTVSSECLADAKSVDQPKFFDASAYVSKGVLVASLPDAPIRLAGTESTVNIHIQGGFVLGRPRKGAVSWDLRDGLFVGRWSVPDVFASFGSYRTDDGKPICTTDAVYPLGKSYVCNSPDILTTIASPTTPCDALSFGICFQAFSAKLGTVFVPPDPTNFCAPGTDPTTDSCSPPLDGGT